MSPNNAVSKKPMKRSERKHRKELISAITPLFDAIKRRRRALEREIDESFERTGFTLPTYGYDEESESATTNPEPEGTKAEYWHEWDILPHQYVQSKLTALDEVIDDALEALEHGSAVEIIEALRVLNETMIAVQTEVEEFLDGRLSQMTRQEWEQLPHWASISTISDDLETYWLVGSVPMIAGIDQVSVDVLEHIYALHYRES